MDDDGGDNNDSYGVSDDEEAEIPGKVKSEIADVLAIAYASAVQQGSAAVVAALGASLVDGPQGEHPSASTLASDANSNALWTKIREMAS